MRLSGENLGSGDILSARADAIFGTYRSFAAEGDASFEQFTAARLGGGGIQADEAPGVDSVGQTAGTSAVLAIGGSTNGFINTAGDQDWYAVTLEAGQSYTFTMVSNGAPLDDAYLQLRTQAGGLLAFDDDFGVGLNPTLRWTALSSGTFYVAAQSFPDNGETGAYTLTAQTSAPASPLDAIDFHFTMPTQVQPGTGAPMISVWFATANFVNGSNDTAVRNWTESEISAALDALSTYSAITPLVFTRAATQAEASWTFSLAQLEGNTLGYFSVGANYAAFDPDVVNFTAGLVPGGGSWVTVIHEAGHGLGMAHPHDNGALDYGEDNSEIMQGVTNAFNSLGSFSLNQGVFTTMTYNDGFRTSSFGATPSTLIGSQSTPMALDVALMQARYGINPNTGAGTSVYTMALADSSYRCIWDVSGIDAISYSGSGNATIDLRPATLLNAVGGGGYVSFVQNIHGGFTIANGVLIENATSGSGNDTLNGNDADNILDGSAGADNLNGGSGNDTYYVDNTSDIVGELLNGGTDTVFSSVTHTLRINVENLTLTGALNRNGTGNTLDNVITGNVGINTLNGNAGNDTLLGDAGNDILTGGAGDDALNGGIGADSMSGGGDNDTYFVDDAGDTVSENVSEGTDTVRSSLTAYTLTANFENLILELGAVSGTGNAVGNTITGNAGANTLSGLEGSDTLNGGVGDDVLDGGIGTDNMNGGANNDTYLVEDASDG